MKILSLKIYTDTVNAYRDGVPRLLDILDELEIEASFFFGMGMEGSGSVLSKLFKDGKEIVASAPGILRDASRRGQDCGIYGWNPREWQFRLEKMKDTSLEADIKRAMEYFARRTGCRPNGFAAPGFRVNYMSLRIQDDMRFKYCSDTFGFYPYLPKMSWKVFATPQIPSNLPPLEIVLRKLSEADVRARFNDLFDNLPDGLSVLPMNSSVCALQEIFAPLYEFLLRCRQRDIKFMSLNKIVKSLEISSLPACEVVTTTGFGMSHEVAVQDPG
ncbi:MAG: polysaccharide deacetylase family protein [Synergistaceae bacterium]|jgi:peptidoglycan/xylan/chitin deacetylase (PgdA/CDA1 family)|nr:polysaccharide deacetylase family protein [Synergistaceae bacterium]